MFELECAGMLQRVNQKIHQVRAFLFELFLLCDTFVVKGFNYTERLILNSSNFECLPLHKNEGNKVNISSIPSEMYCKKRKFNVDKSPTFTGFIFS